MRKGFLFFIFLFLLALPRAQAANDSKLQVENIRYGGGGDKIRIVLDLNQKTDFRAFTLDRPQRIVIDLPSAQWKTYKSRLVSNPIVKSYRSGELKDGLTRIIFDIKQPAIIQQAFIIPKDSFNKDRLVIDLKQSSANAFQASTKDVFGNRRLKGEMPDKSVKKKSPDNSLQAITNEAVKSALKAEGLTPKTPKKYVIVLDPGHGGEDPGAISGNIKEKFITLAVAEELQRQLEETGRYKVVLTRDKDFYIKLHERVDISRRVKGDLFISIHADKIDRKGVRGASIYTLSENASDTETARLAEEENNAGFVAGVDLSQESQDVADILLDLAMREKMNESNLLARMLKTSFQRKSVRLLPNSHRSAGFAVLKAPDVPSVLIETGFISNPDEAKLLSSSQFHRKIATSILEGVDAYFRKMQSLQNP